MAVSMNRGWLLPVMLSLGSTLVIACGSDADGAAGGTVPGVGGTGFPGVAGSSGAGWGGAGGLGGEGATESGGAAGVVGQAGAGGAGGAPGDDCPRAQVKVPAGEVLNVRPAPNTSQAPVGTLDNGAIVDVLGIVTGENVQGNTTWFHVSSPAVSGYVSGVFAECTTAEAPEPPKGYYLPLKCGSSAKVTQGPNGGVSHQGAQKYAYDFALPLNTPVVAMADGTVSHVSLNAKPGDPCYNGGGSSCAPYANRLAIKHADGKSTYYTHLNQVKVTVGQVVTRGSEIGLSGSTGWSTGPHLHVQKQESCGSVSCTSISITFEDAGQPPAGAVVNSKNCP